MLDSIIEDIRSQFSYGNKITQIILVNFFVFLIVVIFKAFSPPDTGFYGTFLENLALSSDFWTILKKPWTLFTHMVLHEGIWHIGWNMLMLYWFGRIVGDLAGDKRIVPLYIIGGLAGAIFYLLFSHIANVSGAIALGASGAVMCFVTAAGFLAPEYNMRLLLIGNVRLKYITVALVLFDLILLSERNNPGGRMAHLGGALMGGFFVHFLRQGFDMTSPFQKGQEMISSNKVKRSNVPMSVIRNKKKPNTSEPSKPERTEDIQKRIDEILDKINVSGYESLANEEKEFLYRASKKS